jgi:uncharacterized membrane protein HdeD (DUF308 family)
MKTFLKNLLIVMLSLVAGSIVNMAFVMVSGKVIPPPEGADITTMEGLKSTMHLFEPKHFLFPFLAHAMGTLVAAFLAAKFSASHHFLLIIIIGCLFMTGGIINVMMLPSPLWFSIVDIAFAYLPMAYFGYRLAGRK